MDLFTLFGNEDKCRRKRKKRLQDSTPFSHRAAASTYEGSPGKMSLRGFGQTAIVRLYTRTGFFFFFGMKEVHGTEMISYL